MNYKAISQEDIDYFNLVCSQDRVFVDQAISEDYSHDELSGIKKYPEVLIKANTTQEVSQIMTYTYENHIPNNAGGVKETGLGGKGLWPSFGGGYN